MWREKVVSLNRLFGVFFCGRGKVNRENKQMFGIWMRESVLFCWFSFCWALSCFPIFISRFNKNTASVGSLTVSSHL